VSEFCDEHVRTLIVHGQSHPLRCSIEGVIGSVLLASQVCELSHQSRLGFGPVFRESREQIVSVTPALFGIVEIIEL